MQNLKTLDETIEEYEELSGFDFEYTQLSNWLKSLREYVEKDTPKKVTMGNLQGNSVCPHCGKHMALSVKNYCDVCGGALLR